MRRVVLRGLFARKLRLALTLLAVALGVSLIVATYVFTDSINGGFDTIFAQTNKGTDAAITGRKQISLEDNQTQPTVSDAILARVRRNADVQVAVGGVFDVGLVLGKNGKKVGAGGAPNFIASTSPVRRFESFTVSKGRFPDAPDEAAVDLGTAKKQHWKLGDRVTVQGEAPRKDYKLVGFTQIAGVDSFGGATVVQLVPAEARRMLGKTGAWDTVAVAGKAGVTPKQLVASLKRELPATVTVRTGQEEARKQSKEISDNLGFLKIALLGFAGISVFVGAFIIFNSFSITVAQRIRELALLRALGASRAQVLGSVVAEGLALGLLGAFAGVALGLVLAPLLKALFVAVGVDLPSSGLVIKPRTIIVPLLVGSLTALLSSIIPAVRATRVPPMAALVATAAPTVGRVSRRLTISGGLLAVAGIVLILLGLLGSGSTGAQLTKVGIGVAAMFVAVALFSPWLVRPMASVLGWPVEKVAGFAGRLARENAVRQPARTAGTAAALMIGVALVTFAAIFAAGAKATIEDAVKSNFKGAFVVQSTDGFSPFTASAMRAIAKIDGVGDTSPIRFTGAKVGTRAGTTTVAGLDPAAFPGLYSVTVKKGPADAVARLADPGVVAVTKGYADKHHTKLGDVLTLRTEATLSLPLKVVAVLEDKGRVIGDLTVSNAVVGSSFGERKDSFGLVGLAPGADAKAVQARIKVLTKQKYPQIEVKTAQKFVDDQAGQVDQLLGLIYALLSLAIIVSLFGIVNTLVLSISERTRELGLLRAIGASRRQVRRMIRWEAVITSMIGGLLGCGLGVVLAVLFTRPLEDFKLTIPFGSIVFLVILSGFAGVLAASFPARRASKLNVLDALAYE